MTGGVGDISKVKSNIETLTKVYSDTTQDFAGQKFVRLGVDMTFSLENSDEVQKIKQFAHDHNMQFIANVVMRRGRASNDTLWQKLAGNRYDELKQLAKDYSDTGGHSTSREGASDNCEYILDPAFDAKINGEVMKGCGYMTEAIGGIGNVKNCETADQLLALCQKRKASLKKSTIADTLECLPRTERDYVEIIKALDS